MDEAARDIFERIRAENGWKGSESISGPGSSRGVTAQLRPQLLGLLPALRINAFADAPGVVQFPLDCGHLGTDAVAELVAKGRDRSIRRGNRAHALGHQDLAHRLRQILSRIDVAEPPALTDRFAALEAQRSGLLQPA